jgi:hypothetical protein
MKKSLFVIAAVLITLTMNLASAQTKCKTTCAKSEASNAACQVSNKDCSACPYGTADCTKCPYTGKSSMKQSKMSGKSVKSSMVKNNAKVAKSSQSLVTMTKAVSSKNDETIKAETPKQ